jgi:hypothetical protein
MHAGLAGRIDGDSEAELARPHGSSCGSEQSIPATVSVDPLSVGRSFSLGQAVLEQEIERCVYLAHLGLAVRVALAGGRHVRGGDAITASGHERVEDHRRKQVQLPSFASVL